MRSFFTDQFGQRSQEKFIFSKRVSEMSIRIFKKCPKLTKMCLNGSAMSPHGLIFDEDGAKSCPMPLDALPTPGGVVLKPF